MVFKTPKQQALDPTPDPADAANRRETERRRRLASGGRQSTLVTRAVQAAQGAAPTATLTGAG